MTAASYDAAPTTAASAVSMPAYRSSSRPGPRIEQAAATSPASSGRTGRSNQMDGRMAPVMASTIGGPPVNIGSGRPRMPTSIANRAPASGCDGSTACDPPPPIVVTNRVERSAPPKAGIVGFVTGTGIRRSTAPSGVTRRTAEPYTQAIQ